MITDEQIKQALELAGVEFQYFVHARTNKQVCTTAGSIDFNKIASGIRELITFFQKTEKKDKLRNYILDLKSKDCESGLFEYEKAWLRSAELELAELEKAE